MNTQPLSRAKDPDLRLSQAALERAARRAREVAARTGTELIVRRDGRIARIRPDAKDMQPGEQAD
jgi:hypothetical protein